MCLRQQWYDEHYSQWNINKDGNILFVYKTLQWNNIMKLIAGISLCTRPGCKGPGDGQEIFVANTDQGEDQIISTLSFSIHNALPHHRELLFQFFHPVLLQTLCLSPLLSEKNDDRSEHINLF